MFAVLNTNGVLWGLDLFATKEAATKDLRSLGVNPAKMTIVELEPWQRTLIDALATAEGIISSLRTKERCPPAEERIVTRYIDGMDQLAAALRKIADGANDPAAVASAALDAQGAALQPA